jgi:hypothetical protein
VLHAAVGDDWLDHGHDRTPPRGDWIAKGVVPRGAGPNGLRNRRLPVAAHHYSRADSKARGAKGNTMEQVPHWLMATVFAAGMTAYAEEVDPQLTGTPISGAPGTPSEPPEAFH